MLMYVLPENRRSFGHNANKAWYVGPCLKHYRTFKGILPLTGKVKMADTVNMKHHAIAIPTLTPENRILEASRQLDRAIKQLPKEGPMDKLAAVELLRKMFWGENKDPLQMNSVQKQRERERAHPVPRSTVEQSPATSVTTAVSLPTLAPATTPSPEEDDMDAPPPATFPRQRLRRSKRVIEQSPLWYRIFP